MSRKKEPDRNNFINKYLGANFQKRIRQARYVINKIGNKKLTLMKLSVTKLIVVASNQSSKGFSTFD